MAFRGIMAWVAVCGWFAAAGWLAVSADVVRVELVVGLEEPIALDVARDGRVILVERRGAVKVWDPVGSRIRTVGKLPVFSGPEDGILGLALHPGFATNG
jgi:glucose/arabinose dehydrogenase